MVASGKSKSEKGDSIMSTTVGVTCALTTRLLLEKKIRATGFVSPTEKEIYEPVLAQLEKDFGVTMIEESSNHAASMKMSGHNRAKL